MLTAVHGLNTSSAVVFLSWTMPHVPRVAVTKESCEHGSRFVPDSTSDGWGGVFPSRCDST